MASGCPLTCYSFIKHCLCVAERKGDCVMLVMNDQRVTSSLLTPNTGKHAHTHTYTPINTQSQALMHIQVSKQTFVTLKAS